MLYSVKITKCFSVKLIMLRLHLHLVYTKLHTIRYFMLLRCIMRGVY